MTGSRPAVRAALLWTLLASPAMGQSAEMQQVLDKHNVFRCMHGVPAFTWDADIAANAQSWANNGVYEHSDGSTRIINGEQCGENLAIGTALTDGTQAVQMWYDEIRNTNGGLVTAFSADTGHYTQVVWKASTKLGCGRGTAPFSGTSGHFWVCQYGPAGNFEGQFEENVVAPVKTEAECPSGQAPATTAPGTPTQAPATPAPGTPTQAPATGVPATAAPGTPTEAPATPAPGAPTEVPATAAPGGPTEEPATASPTPSPEASTALPATDAPKPGSGEFCAAICDASLSTERKLRDCYQACQHSFDTLKPILAIYCKGGVCSCNQQGTVTQTGLLELDAMTNEADFDHANLLQIRQKEVEMEEQTCMKKKTWCNSVCTTAVCPISKRDTFKMCHESCMDPASKFSELVATYCSV
eukprot:CAMPEP_0194760318 /NCGR_PEP_ID=MMETSP0323_2-20130528/13251_1 /TAXON_ID=2866 ORGANISM="Crypthecodinium cohnii, Strain Seligo" /NCGR_SAMPLE_ID=MMETSP0323_2 /ASSEMBLY_ACC=CAM_ASM_000346 /LENGTH=413 /DNA_ID=CAMNT_0039681531 /DNA_START=30 /DNA_END=1271 /DNA_ORIENTATION=+